MKSNFTYKVDRNGKWIIIVDTGGSNDMSVTNDAENVIDHIAKIEDVNPPDFKIIYRDSLGVWDAIVPNDYRVTFMCLNKRSQNEAKERYLQISK